MSLSRDKLSCSFRLLVYLTQWHDVDNISQSQEHYMYSMNVECITGAQRKTILTHFFFSEYSFFGIFTYNFF